MKKNQSKETVTDLGRELLGVAKHEMIDPNDELAVCRAFKAVLAKKMKDVPKRPGVKVTGVLRLHRVPVTNVEGTEKPGKVDVFIDYPAYLEWVGWCVGHRVTNDQPVREVIELLISC